MEDSKKDVKGKILVVDDNEGNRELLSEALLKESYEVMVAEDGFAGYKKAVSELPDLILLDIMMPGMDGYGTCEKLKSKEETKDIPVIFITALSKTDEIVKGFEVGGVDYVTKPVKLRELLARVSTQLRLKKLEEERVETLTDRLRATHWDTIRSISEGLAHNFNNILAVVGGNLQFIGNSVEDDDLKEAVEDSEEMMKRAVRLVELMQMFRTLEPDPSPVDLPELINDTIEELEEQGMGGSVAIEITGSAPVSSPGSRPYIKHALKAALINAFEATEDNGGKVAVSLVSTNGKGKPSAEIKVSDKGRGLDQETAEKAFTPFFSTKNTVGVGLGLYSAKMSVEQLGGRIELLPGETGGASTVISLPLHSEGE